MVCYHAFMVESRVAGLIQISPEEQTLMKESKDLNLTEFEPWNNRWGSIYSIATMEGVLNGKKVAVYYLRKSNLPEDANDLWGEPRPDEEKVVGYKDGKRIHTDTAKDIFATYLDILRIKNKEKGIQPENLADRLRESRLTHPGEYFSFISSPKIN